MSHNADPLIMTCIQNIRLEKLLLGYGMMIVRWPGDGCVNLLCVFFFKKMPSCRNTPENARYGNSHKHRIPGSYIVVTFFEVLNFVYMSFIGDQIYSGTSASLPIISKSFFGELRISCMSFRPVLSEPCFFFRNSTQVRENTLVSTGTQPLMSFARYLGMFSILVADPATDTSEDKFCGLNDSRGQILPKRSSLC